MAARQPAYLNIVKQERGHGATTECLAAAPGASTNEERNRKPGVLTAVEWTLQQLYCTTAHQQG